MSIAVGFEPTADRRHNGRPSTPTHDSNVLPAPVTMLAHELIINLYMYTTLKDYACQA